MKNKDIKNILKKAVVAPVAGLVIVSVVACGQKPIEGVSTEPTSSIQWETQEAQESTHEAEADDLLNGGTESQAEQETSQETQEEAQGPSFWDPTEFDEADYVQKRLKEGYEAYESYEGSVVAENFKAGEVYTVTGLWDRVENGELVAGLFRIQNEAGEVAYAPNLWFEDVQEEVAEVTEESQGSEEAATEPSQEVAQGGEEEAEPSEEVAQGSQEAPSQEAPSQEAPSQAPQESQSTQLSSGTYVGGEDRDYAGGYVVDGVWYASWDDWEAAMGIETISGPQHYGTPSDGNYTWE